MLQDKVNTFTKFGLSAVGIAFLLIAIISIVPAITVWVINEISNAGGSDFRLAHGLWNYFLCLIVLTLLRARAI